MVNVFQELGPGFIRFSSSNSTPGSCSASSPSSSPCVSSCSGSRRKRPSARGAGSVLVLFLFGGGLLLIYAIQRQDPVFIAGQALGMFIYVRNLWLIANERKAAMTKVD